LRFDPHTQGAGCLIAGAALFGLLFVGFFCLVVWGMSGEQLRWSWSMIVFPGLPLAVLTGIFFAGVRLFNLK
jgi:hypothetical protein